MNTIQKTAKATKNYLRTSTAAYAKEFSYDATYHLLPKPRHIFLALWTLAFVWMALSLGACSPGSLTKTSSIESSSQEKASSNDQPSRISHANQFLYMAQEEIETQEEPETVSSAATGSVKLNLDRLLTLSGVIDEGMFAQANKLIALADKSDAPIDIVIASPGGYISHGLMFIQAMNDVKKKGVVIRCYVTSLAASMAFNIFTQCSERYALPYATLLFHSPRISGQFTIDAQGSRQLSVDLTKLEILLLNLIVPVMGVNKRDEHQAEWFVANYNAERLFLATDLAAESPTKWFTVVARIEGYPGSFPAPYSPSSGSSDVRRTGTKPSVKEAGR